MHTRDLVERGYDAVALEYAKLESPEAPWPRMQQLELMLDRFAGWLKEGGYLLFTTESEEWPDEVGDWLGAPMFFSQYDPDTTARLLQAAGFELVSTNTETQLEGGREVEYVWFLAERRGSRGTGLTLCSRSPG